MVQGLRLIESSVTGADRGCETGTSSSLPENGTIGTVYTSTGGESPGSSNREQYGYQDAVPNKTNRMDKGVGMSRWTWVTTAGVLLHTKGFGNGDVMANKKGGCVGGESVPE